jgi:hypothetical protein
VESTSGVPEQNFSLFGSIFPPINSVFKGKTGTTQVDLTIYQTLFESVSTTGTGFYWALNQVNLGPTIPSNRIYEVDGVSFSFDLLLAPSTIGIQRTEFQSYLSFVFQLIGTFAGLLGLYSTILQVWESLNGQFIKTEAREARNFHKKFGNCPNPHCPNPTSIVVDDVCMGCFLARSEFLKQFENVESDRLVRFSTLGVEISLSDGPNRLETSQSTASTDPSAVKNVCETEITLKQ